MIKLVSFKNCPFVQRVMGALVMKNVPFEIEYIELNNKPQWFLDISPNGQVPVLITEKALLRNSMELNQEPTI
ncbi:glutathione S-transferase N-terminal domain-containing protein [Vibrio splendidus]